MRDTAGLGVDLVSDPVLYLGDRTVREAAAGLRLVDRRARVSSHHSLPVHPSLCRCLQRLYAPHEASLAPRLCDITELVQPVPIGDALAHVA